MYIYIYIYILYWYHILRQTHDSGDGFMGVPVVAHLFIFRQLNRASVSWKMPPSVWRWLDWQGFLQGCFKGSILQMELEVRTFLNLGCF
jgi:hypothetical protein